MKLKRFEEYQATAGEMTGLGGGRIAYVNEVHLIPVPEAGARVAGLESGEYDYAEALPMNEYDRLKENKKIETFVHKPESWMVLEFNHADKFAGNLKFRQAIQAGLDMEAIMMAVTSGRPEFYRIQPSIFFNEQTWWTDEAKELYNQKDLAKAKQLLKDAGYNGEEIVMLTNRDYDSMYKVVLTAADQLKKNLGMNIKVETLDWPGQRTKEKSKEGWNITVTFYSLRFDGGDFSASMHSMAKRKFYSNPTMDQIFDEGASTTDFEQRKQIYAQAQRFFYEDVQAIKIGDFHGLEAVNSKVKGFRSWYTPRFWNVWKE
jgi:peptide/nickel transport system substrate-binding protein